MRLVHIGRYEKHMFFLLNFGTTVSYESVCPSRPWCLHCGGSPGWAWHQSGVGLPLQSDTAAPSPSLDSQSRWPPSKNGHGRSAWPGHTVPGEQEREGNVLSGRRWIGTNEVESLQDQRRETAWNRGRNTNMAPSCGSHGKHWKKSIKITAMGMPVQTRVEFLPPTRRLNCAQREYTPFTTQRKCPCKLSKFQFKTQSTRYLLVSSPQSSNVLESWKYRADIINRLTPIFSGPVSGQFASEINQKQSERDSHRNTNSVCDSPGDSLLPTSSAHTIIHFSNGPGAKACRGDSPALLKQWVGPGCVSVFVYVCVCVYVCVGGVYGLDSLIIQQHTLTFRIYEHVCRKYSEFVFVWVTFEKFHVLLIFLQFISCNSWQDNLTRTREP